MASENAKLDDNEKPVAMAVTDDSNLYRKMFRIDDTTKGLKVMLVGGGGTGTITSITAGTGLTATVANPIVASGTIALDSKLAPLDTLGTALQSIRVNAGATALEYYSPAGGLSGSGNANEIAYFTAGTVLGSLAVATYPNLTELSYVKGVTSGIQAQINGKQASGSYLTGNQTITLSGIVTGSGATAITTSFGTFTSATLATALSDETGTGVAVFNNKPTFLGTIQTITAIGALAFDGSTGNMFTKTISGIATFTQSNFSTGQNFIINITGAFAITWWSGITWYTTGATAPTQGAVTSYGFTCTGASTFNGYLVGTQ